jgi:hypothetical protein
MPGKSAARGTLHGTALGQQALHTLELDVYQNMGQYQTASLSVHEAGMPTKEWDCMFL